ncbi:MAG: class I SAM-dependent methyltransferase [Candidatus Competibacterales bacterium]
MAFFPSLTRALRRRTPKAQTAPQPPSANPGFIQQSDSQRGLIWTLEIPTPRLDYPVEYLRGWWYADDPDAQAVVTLDGLPFPLYRDARPDLPDPRVRGFHLFVDLVAYLNRGGRDERWLEMALVLDGRPVLRQTFEVAAEAFAAVRRFARAREQRQRYLAERLRCPRCPCGLERRDGAWWCRACDTRYDTGANGILSVLPADLEQASRLTHKRDPVSAHLYHSKRLLPLINAVGQRSGWVLDVGAGLRRQVLPQLFCVELYDYPSTDVRATGDGLPFKDDSFDLVISNAVLEHVADPFADAKELVRVLKPGGTLFTTVPLLQPEHGYPQHYFNMTRTGVRQLFGDAIEVTEHFTIPENGPLFALQWQLAAYLDGLPPAEREAFAATTVAELAHSPLGDLLAEPFARRLSAEATWALTGAHTLVGRKRRA